MADVRPFRALRYAAAAGPLGTLVSPPYDVISAEERRGYLAVSPYNAVRLILPEVGYDEVAGLISAWCDDGVLTRSEEPVLIAWTQSFTLGDGVPRERRTILAAVGLEPYEARVVRPHERTHAGPKEDRLRLTRAVRTNLSPVFGLYPDAEGVAWAAVAPTGEPDAEVRDAEGTVHRFWRVADPAAAAGVAEAMRDRWILIADGHHRYETALAYRDEVRAAGGGDGPHDRVLMGLTALDDPGLVVLPTHRLLTRWPEGADAAFDAAPVAGLDALLAALEAAPEDSAALGLVTADGMRLLTAPARPGMSPAERLDVAALEREILVPHLGADQAALAHDEVLSYTKDAAEAAGLVASGAIAAAVILRGIPKSAVADVAEAGETMPQKSTYFFPKLLTGVAFHSLVDA
ncbi:DUF1015 family protein [Miltoncostaea oceani]|uniref:DUF1015 family protein n=1 Tax=Miltoncostaea oceani TaxID=2843216 RepID=UPI001C3C25AC|nr:DUF1015 domain-containing protein [Miltoncostaea oceani]